MNTSERSKSTFIQHLASSFLKFTVKFLLQAPLNCCHMSVPRHSLSKSKILLKAFFCAVIEIKRCTSLDDRLIYGASAALMAALTPVVADHHAGFVIAHSFTAPLNSEASKLVEKRRFWSHDSFHSVVSVQKTMS